MFRRIGWFIGLNNYNYLPKRLSDAKPRPAKVKPVAIMDTTQEIAIYIHRFHNLDLFQQGWYQIKITMRWEDSQYGSPGTPSRVVQYEAPDLGSDDIHGIWRIDDKDNSFSTQPFRIKYARQDVLLSVMVSFNMSLGKFEGPSTCAVILKFELMYAPITENRSGLQAALDSCPAAVHEFRVPPKALLGLHSYCPVHFDAFHAVLVDTAVHITVLKSRSGVAAPKANSDSCNGGDHSGENVQGFGQSVGRLASLDERQVAVLRTLLAVYDLLLEEMQNLSRAIGQAIDLTDETTEWNNKELLDLRAELGIAEGKSLGPDKLWNDIEKAKHDVDMKNGRMLPPSSRDGLMHFFHLLGNRVLYLWNAFLNFHRANKTKIIEYLHDAWCTDRRAEWSIWMVYTKVEMPHHYIHSGADEHRRVSSLWKLANDPAQSAVVRADLHRRSIGQMRINNRSIQDMHIFGDPSCIPIVIVERVINAPRRTVSVNSYFSHMKDSPGLLSGPSYEVAQKPSTQQNSHVLKIVVFVHGFQGHHLDLRLVRNQWLLIDPKIEFLMSEVNEDKTSGDFREMGHRLAQEVISFLKKKMDKFSRSRSLRNIKLSFVGHSIGNLIIRTALAASIMEPYLRFLYTYVSISGPHLGYLYSSNSLFNSGLWVLKKLKGTQCIHQLTFTDDPDLENTFLYKLCKQKTLENFRHILLLSSPQLSACVLVLVHDKLIDSEYLIEFVGSAYVSIKHEDRYLYLHQCLSEAIHLILLTGFMSQDGYVPYHSARIELCQAASSDNSKKAKIFMEMLNDCLDQIRAQSCEHRVFMRCDVNFDTSSQGRNLNTLIGRAAHIEFLESDVFARFIMWSFPEIFR